MPDNQSRRAGHKKPAPSDRRNMIPDLAGILDAELEERQTMTCTQGHTWVETFPVDSPLFGVCPVCKSDPRTLLSRNWSRLSHNYRPKSDDHISVRVSPVHSIEMTVVTLHIPFAATNDEINDAFKEAALLLRNEHERNQD